MRGNDTQENIKENEIALDRDDKQNAVVSRKKVTHEVRRECEEMINLSVVQKNYCKVLSIVIEYDINYIEDEKPDYK